MATTYGPECVKTQLRSKALYRIFSLYVEAADGFELNDDRPLPQHSQRNADDRCSRRFDSLFGLPGRCRYFRAKFRCSSPQSGSCYAVRSFGLGSHSSKGSFNVVIVTFGAQPKPVDKEPIDPMVFFDAVVAALK